MPTAFYRHFDSIDDARPRPGRRVLRLAARDDARRTPRRPGVRPASSTARSTSWSSTCTPSASTSGSSPASGRPGRPWCARRSATRSSCSSASSPPTWPGCRAPTRGRARTCGCWSNLIVTSIVGHRRARSSRAGPDAEAEIVERARTQLRMVLIGALNWRSPRLTVPHAMGLAADLDYRHSTGNPVQRAGRWVAGTRVGGWVFSRTLRHLDNVIGRLTRGRHSAPGLLTGLAVLDLTTTGRKSGQRRTSHLIATPSTTTLALLGTNFGQESTPAWALNLEADPRATVSYRGTSREVDGPARPRRPRPTRSSPAPPRSTPATGTTAQRIGERRRIRVFVLLNPGRQRGLDRQVRRRSRRRRRSSTCRIASATVSGRIHASASYVLALLARAPSPASGSRSGPGRRW